MKRMSEVYEIFTKFQALVENLFDHIMKHFQINGWWEFDNFRMLDLFLKNGIYFWKSYHDTQQRNGVLERKHHHILEMVRTFLIDAPMTAYLCVDVVHAMVYTINRLTTPVLQQNKSFEVLFKRVSDYTFLKPFGWACFPNFMASSTNALQPWSMLCVFLRYVVYYKEYRCLDPIIGHVYLSRHVRFHETS